MTTATPERPQKKKVEENKKEEKLISSNDYGCEILLEKTTIEKSKDPSFPDDAYLIWYVVNEETHIDLTRSGKKSDLFDFYYDMYGPEQFRKLILVMEESVQGYGDINNQKRNGKENECRIW